MSWWEAVLLGLVQGLTEFLPVSSSGHLVLGQYLLGLEEAGNVTFEVFVHFGTVLSILTVYWKRIGSILSEFFGGVARPHRLRAHYEESEPFRFAVFVLITMVPTGVAYLIFENRIKNAFEMPRFTCWMLLVTGVLLLLTVLRRNPKGSLGPVKAFFIGVAQSFAMLPGISRSGSTICTALYQNVSPRKAADFSFLMSLPVIVGATLLESLDIWGGSLEVDAVPLIAGTAAAYVAGVAAIRAMVGLVSRGNLHYFAFYLFVVGTVGLFTIEPAATEPPEEDPATVTVVETPRSHTSPS